MTARPASPLLDEAVAMADAVESWRETVRVALYYSPPIAMAREANQRARNRAAWSLQISYDLIGAAKKAGKRNA